MTFLKNGGWAGGINRHQSAKFSVVHKAGPVRIFVDGFGSLIPSFSSFKKKTMQKILAGNSRVRIKATAFLFINY
jgi:hypothetical protein